MDQKKIGVILVLIGLAVGGLTAAFRYNTAQLIDVEMELSGNICVQDGVCLHNEYAFNGATYAGIVLAALTIGLGLYLLFSARSQQAFMTKLDEVKKGKKEDERFQIMLKALSPEERLIMEKVREQDGITQTTLMLRTDLSKTKLSFVLADLEKKGLVKKVKEGKINRVHLKEAV